MNEYKNVIALIDMIDFTSKEIYLYFEKAKIKYQECISSKDNKFLMDELNCELESLRLQELNIKFIFSVINLENYVVEVNFLLTDNQENEIGKYVYQESNDGESIDDSLIFY